MPAYTAKKNRSSKKKERKMRLLEREKKKKKTIDAPLDDSVYLGAAAVEKGKEGRTTMISSSSDIENDKQKERRKTSHVFGKSRSSFREEKKKRTGSRTSPILPCSGTRISGKKGKRKGKTQPYPTTVAIWR